MMPPSRPWKRCAAALPSSSAVADAASSLFGLGRVPPTTGGAGSGPGSTTDRGGGASSNHAPVKDWPPSFGDAVLRKNPLQQPGGGAGLPLQQPNSLNLAMAAGTSAGPAEVAPWPLPNLVAG
eukprot:SM000542S18205  [mRNA]  locus=s542:2363:3457:+ [translate_table: standard]